MGLVVLESKDNAVFVVPDASDTGSGGTNPKDLEVDEVACGLRQWAVTIGDLLGNVFDGVRILRFGDLTVDLESAGLARDHRLEDTRFDSKVDLDRDRLLGVFPSEVIDSALE